MSDMKEWKMNMKEEMAELYASFELSLMTLLNSMMKRKSKKCCASILVQY